MAVMTDRMTVTVDLLADGHAFLLAVVGVEGVAVVYDEVVALHVR